MDAPLHDELKAAIQSKDVDAAIAALFASKLRLCNAFKRTAGAATTAFTNAYHRRNSHANSVAIAAPTSSLLHEAVKSSGAVGYPSLRLS